MKRKRSISTRGCGLYLMYLFVSQMQLVKIIFRIVSSIASISFYIILYISHHQDTHFPTIVASMLSCSVEIFPGWVHCKRKISVQQDKKNFSCELCGERLRSDKLLLGLVGSLKLENGDEEDPLLLTFFPKVMKLYPFLSKNFFKPN